VDLRAPVLPRVVPPRLLDARLDVLAVIAAE
jgi:hypothetical protein